VLSAAICFCLHRQRTPRLIDPGLNARLFSATTNGCNILLLILRHFQLVVKQPIALASRALPAPGPQVKPLPADYALASPAALSRRAKRARRCYFIGLMNCSETKKRVAKAFDRAVEHYPQHAGAQNKASSILRSQCPIPPDNPQLCVVDIGCGGHNPPAWKDVPRTGVDISRNSLQNWPFASICCDGEALGIRERSADVLVCASTMQWIQNTQECLSEFSRILKPGGWFGYAVLLQGSFASLLAARSRAGVTEPVKLFSATNWTSLLQRNHFVPVRQKMQQIAQPVHSAYQLLDSLRHLGSAPQSMSQLRVIYKILHKLANNGQLEHTYCYSIGWARKVAH